MLIPKHKGPGVYGIINLVSGKVYVGSSLVVSRRLQAHRSELRRGVHENPYLQRAWHHHGEKSFRFHLLEECLPEECVDKELMWTDALESMNRKYGYNLTVAGKSAMLGRKHTPESIAKMRESHKDDTNWVVGVEAAAKVNRGRKRPAEVRARMSAAQKGRKKTPEQIAALKANHWSKRPDAHEIAARAAAKNRGKKHSEEHKKKIGQGHWKYREDADEISAKVSASLKRTAAQTRSEDTQET